MVAGIWFQRMSASDLLRAISPPDVLVLLLLPGAFAFVPMLVAILLAILVFEHRLTLAEAVDPAVGVLLVLEIARHVLAKLAADRTGGLSAADATVIETVGEGRGGGQAGASASARRGRLGA